MSRPAGSVTNAVQIERGPPNRIGRREGRCGAIGMIELLAIPAWGAPPRDAADWLAGFEAIGQPARIEAAPPEGEWIEVPDLRLRGFLLPEDGRLAAIHFELHAPDPDPARLAVEAVALALDWELHDDDEDDDLDDD